jgi:hypothetical protein
LSALVALIELTRIAITIGIAENALTSTLAIDVITIIEITILELIDALTIL